MYIYRLYLDIYIYIHIILFDIVFRQQWTIERHAAVQVHARYCTITATSFQRQWTLHNITLISFYIIISRHWCIIEHDFKIHRKLHISFLTFFLGSPGWTLSETLPGDDAKAAPSMRRAVQRRTSTWNGSEKTWTCFIILWWRESTKVCSISGQAFGRWIWCGYVDVRLCFTIFHEVRHILMDSPAPCSRVAHAKRPNASGAQEHLTIQVPEEQLFRTAQPPADELQRDPHQQWGDQLH